MANLIPSELFKNQNSRTNVFLSKLKQESGFKNKFKLRSGLGGKEVELVADQREYTNLEKVFDEGVRHPHKRGLLNKYEFVDTEGGRYIGTGSFFKTKEFGSTGGSGGGSKVTQEAESGQCVYNACYANTVGFSNGDLQKAYDSSNVDVTESQFGKINKLQEQWVISMQTSAIALARFNNKNLIFTNSYEHHRGSQFVKMIEKKFKELNRKEPYPFSNINKWNPADIWIVRTSAKQEIKTDINDATNIIQLNDLLTRWLTSNALVGVSLKQVGNRAKVTYHNYTERGDWRKPKWVFKSVSMGLRTFGKSKDVYINFPEGKMQCRAFEGDSAWQGTIKGKLADHGKVSGSAGQESIMGKYVKEHLRKTLSKDRNIKSDYYNNYDIRLRAWWEMLEKIKTEHGWQLNEMPKSQADLGSIIHAYKDQGGQLAPVNFWVSKYMGTELAYYIHEATKEQRDNLITSILSYASSQSEKSAPFVKIA